MTGLRFMPLGVGDAFSARWYSSCLLVQSAQTRVLIDCPHPIRKMMTEAGKASGWHVDVGDVDAVLLTHLHADHCSGLEGFGYYSHFVLDRRAVVYAHPSVAERLWPGCLAAGMEKLISGPGPAATERTLADYFDVRTLREESAVRIGDLTVECRPTIHHVPTTAFRIRSDSAALGYSADTTFDPGLLDWLGHTDRFVHETNHGAHTAYEDLAALSPELRQRMWLIHYPDDFNLEDSCIEPLRQGSIYHLK